MALYGIVNLAAAAPLRLRVMALKSPQGEPLLGRQSFADTLAVGPWLVDLDLVPDVVAAWKTQGQWQGWGYTFISTRDFASTLRHFKKFNRVTLEGSEKQALFRYFDVAIFLEFMVNASTPEQSSAMFKGISQFNIEDKKTKQLFELRPHNQQPAR